MKTAKQLYDEYQAIPEDTRVYYTRDDGSKIYGRIVRVVAGMGGKYGKAWYENRVLVDGDSSPTDLFWPKVRVSKYQCNTPATPRSSES